MNHFAALLTSAACATFVAAGAATQRTARTSGSTVISPSVIGSYVITADESGNGTLEFLILWRGSPGWFQRRSGLGGSMSSGGGSFGRPGDPVMNLSVRQGGLNLTATYEASGRIATVLSEKIALADANVILVDDVDDPNGPRVLKTLAAGRALGRSAGPYPTLISSPELLDFLRCHAQTPDRSAMNYVCAEAIARGLVAGERTVTPIPVGPVQNRAADTSPPRPPRPAGPGQSAGEGVLSPVVVGAWFTHRDAAGSAALDLLVLWRGSLGWALRGSQSGGSGGGSNTGRRGMSVRRGDLVLYAAFDEPARACEIEDQRVPLADHNVVLVDDVDSPGGPRVIKTLRVDPDLPDANRVDAAIRRSAELIAFLRCDLRLPNERQQATMDILCSRVTGK